MIFPICQGEMDKHVTHLQERLTDITKFQERLTEKDKDILHCKGD